MKLGILGCGNWGSVFGIIQAKNGHQVKIWEFNRERAIYVQKTRDNAPFLIDYKIPKEIEIDWQIERVLSDVDAILFAVPCQRLPDALEAVRKTNKASSYYISLIKGIEIKSLKRPSEIIRESLKIEEVYILAGPSIANEIIRKEPAALVVAGPRPQICRRLQYELSTSTLRIYQASDLIGVELGAAIKNVLAIACGISDGLGFGANAKGALIARGIVEMQRLGERMGAKARTFWGLSGLGDLVTTAFSEESRNHKFGRMVGEGKTLEDIKKRMVMVAEGVPTAQAIKRLIKRYKIEMPICEVVYEIIFNKKPPRQAMKELMARPLKNE